MDVDRRITRDLWMNSACGNGVHVGEEVVNPRGLCYRDEFDTNKEALFELM